MIRQPLSAFSEVVDERRRWNADWYSWLTELVAGSNVVPKTFSALGSPSVGDRAIISDSSTAAWGATVAGGGANKVLAWYNGTNWTVIGV